MSNVKHWWINYPWRMVQTNFREIDMDGIDAESYARSLADFGATVVTLNAGGILASYESKLPYHTVSKYLTGSSLKEIVDACHKRGIRVIARMDFSKIPYAVYEQHPDWAFRTADGGIVHQNGFVQTCQNSEYQQEKVVEILTELLTTHPFDGVYCNMSGFVATGYDGRIYGMCTCDRCKAGFQAAFHLDVPDKLDSKNPVTMRYMGFQAGCGKKLRAKMTAAIKAISPEIAVDKVDYLRSESHTDIDIPIWVYSASSHARQTAFSGLVCDNASVDYMGFRYRESSVSPGVSALRQWQNLANAGTTSVYVIGRLDNHRDKSTFEAHRKVFRFHKAQEALLTGLRSAAEVLLVMKSQQSRSDPESFGWIRALTASHVPFDEVKTSGVTEYALKDKKLVILADAKDLQPEQCALLDAFVQKGGMLVSSGDSGVRGDSSSLQCLGIEKAPERKKTVSTVFTLTDPDAQVLKRSAQAPVIAPGSEIRVCAYAPGVKKLLRTEPEPHYGPPEIAYHTTETENPGLTVHSFGSGKAVYIPWFCGSFYHNEGYTNTLNIMQDVLFELCGLPQIAPGLHPSVELVLKKKENKTVVFLINASGYFGNSFFDPIPMADIALHIPGHFVKAEALNGGQAVLENGVLHLNKLDDFEMLVLEEN